MIVTVTLNAALDRTVTVPNFQRGQRHRASQGLTLAGGKGINIARALKRLDVPVVATGLAGGRTGTRIVEELTAEAILNDFVRIADESRTTTAVEVRDSPSMWTKSLRIASAVSCSTIRDPVPPPTSPVATTGTPSVLSARATLMPLPPARVTPALARWRCPRWKFGTVRVRSIAALSVTVTIKRSCPGHLEKVGEMVKRPSGVPG